MEEKKVLTVDDYFKSEEHKIIFAVLYTDTSLREKLLGISEELYLDEEKAKEWRNHLVKKIHPDNCKLLGAEEAIKKINEMYSRMVELDDDEDEESGDSK